MEVHFLARYPKHIAEIDLSRDGLGMFTTLETKKAWLEYCMQFWKRNPTYNNLISTYFNEALAAVFDIPNERKYHIPRIKGLSGGELDILQIDVDESLEHDYPAPGKAEPDLELQDYAASIIHTNTVKFYKFDNFARIDELHRLVTNENVRKVLSSFIFSAITFGRGNIKPELDFKDLNDSDYQAAFKIATNYSRFWKDEQTIAGPFQAGAEVFGYKRMLTYTQREGLSLHDAVHAFRDVMALYEASELRAGEFYNNVLHQVVMDSGEYSEGTAHHCLNAIAQTANKDIAEVIALSQEYREIERFQELVTTLDSSQKVFASWRNLKRYSELEQLLGQKEILIKLKKLKAEGSEALYRYVETLAFHPDSKVNKSAVIQFWRNPEAFLAASASHTPDSVQDRKKPSNYIHMPNLDLTATELRDALVEEKMDQIQVFAPLEVRYEIPMEEIIYPPLREAITMALEERVSGDGSKVAALAQSPQKLIVNIRYKLKKIGVDYDNYISGKTEIPTDYKIQLEQEIFDLVYGDRYGMGKPKVKTRTFVARISRKSDPEGAIAGDDTVNCMPFGDGKNTVYTFNPNTAQLVIRVVNDDGKERTIAQSVLTKDMDIQMPVPDIISGLTQAEGHLEDVLPEGVLRHALTYIACDNVEVSPNYLDKRHKQILEVIMRDYFREYVSRYAEAQRLEPTKVPIGQENSDALTNLPTALNTFAPQAPVSYSDKTGKRVYMLDLTEDEGLKQILKRTVTAPEASQITPSVLPDMPGIGYLTFEDSLRVGYLEGKAYKDNKSLVEYLFNMENALIAKDINNAAKKRPNMSLKYTDSEGQMRGYLLAWEGRLDDESLEHEAQDFFGKPCVYISDIATDQENRMAGGRLIKAFTDLYKQNYLDKGNPLPIFAQARETTSFRIVQRQLDRIGEEVGVEFELIELPTYQVGKDTMHPIIIQPKFIQ